MAWSYYCAGTLDDSVVVGIFVAALRAVGCAATLAAAGLWLAKRGLMTPSLSKGLSQLSVKLAIPALLFSSMVPGMSFELLGYGWMLMLLPAIYLLIGFMIGHLMLYLVLPPADFRLGTVAACTFGNTTGIPIVLLSVLQQSLSRSVFADIADPLLFLSLELVTFPLLQWLFGLLLLRGRSGADDPLLGASRAPEDEGMLHSILHAPQPSSTAGGGIRRNTLGEESSSYISMMSQGEDEVVPFAEESTTPPPSVAEKLYTLVPLRQYAHDGCRGLGKLLRRTFVPQVVGIVGGALVGLYARHLVLPPETALSAGCTLASVN